jgi:hypothetical protein
MGTNVRPNIVTNGLVLALDAANTKSYPRTGTTWRDLSGNNNSGSLVNSPTFNSLNGGSIVFNGTNQYVSVPYVSSLNPTNITVNIWIKRISAVSYSHPIILPVSNTTWANPYMAYGVEYLSTTDTLSFILGFTTNTYASTDITVPGNNIWFNYTGTYDGSNVRVYLNGTLQITRAETRTKISTTANLYLGAINTSTLYPFNGNIPTAQIYNRALSASEVLQNYNALKSRFNLK